MISMRSEGFGHKHDRMHLLNWEIVFEVLRIYAYIWIRFWQNEPKFLFLNKDRGDFCVRLEKEPRARLGLMFAKRRR